MTHEMQYVTLALMHSGFDGASSGEVACSAGTARLCALQHAEGGWLF
jgi:hypothetical protein